MEKVDVNFTNDIRLKEIKIQQGEYVSKGELLFNYVQNQFDNDANFVIKTLDKEEKRNSLQNQWQHKIDLKKLEITHIENEIQMQQIEHESIQELVLLDVYTKTKLNEVYLHLQGLHSKKYLLERELKLLEKQKSLTNSNYYDNPKFSNAYYSPISGVIGQILKNSEESCYKSENVMTIHDYNKVFVKAYFNLKDIATISEGRAVIVEFPDKSTSKGIINKLFISTYEAPNEFQKKYEPTERNILAEIIPTNKNEITNWSKYYKLNVKVKLYKF
ncbi:HlyD family efflux transporter periplasmic adaptor subunit [Urechidicola sp. KH5]